MLAILFVVSCSIMFSATLAYSPATGYIQFPYFLKYILSFAWFILAAASTLVSNNMRIRKNRVKDLIVYTVPAFLMAFSIVFAVVFQNLSGDYFSRSVSNLLCMLTIFLGIYAAVSLFGNKAIDYAFYGLILSTLINVVYTISIYGVINVFKALINITSIVGFTYANGTLMSNIGYSLEVADATFAYGFYFLYYLCFVDKSKLRTRRLIICLFGMYIGLKRIEIFAIILSIVVFYLFEKRKVNFKSILYGFLGALLLLSFVFIYMIKYHTSVFAFLDIYRVGLYNAIKSMFTISPMYIGKGYGYVNKWLSDVGAKLWILSESHSDVLRMYVELGFAGFILWLSYYAYYLPNYFLKRSKTRIAKIVLCFTVYIMTTYLIDNTMLLFATQFCFILIPMADGHGYIKHNRIVFKRRNNF